MVAEATLRSSPEPLRDDTDCERLACPAERLRGESETAAVHRFTSGTDEATPSAATRENSSRAPSAFWKLPGPGRPPAPRPRSRPIWLWLRETFARPHRHQSCTQVTQPVMRSTEARPRISSSRVPQRTTPPYSSNRDRSIGFFIWVTRSFSPRNPTASHGARGVAPAGPRSPGDLATLAPARGHGGGSERLGGGKSLPAADLPNDAAGESAV